MLGAFFNLTGLGLVMWLVMSFTGPISLRLHAKIRIVQCTVPMTSERSSKRKIKNKLPCMARLIITMVGKEVPPELQCGSSTKSAFTLT